MILRRLMKGDIMIKKERLDYFNTVLDTIKGLGLIAVGGLALLYFLFPDIERFVRASVMDESKHFYVGEWNDRSKKFIDKAYRLYPEDHDSSTGLVKRGNVILATEDTIVGRTKYGRSEGLAAYVGKAGDCLFVLESTIRDITDTDSPDDKAIWVRALPKSCK